MFGGERENYLLNPSVGNPFVYEDPLQFVDEKFDAEQMSIGTNIQWPRAGFPIPTAVEASRPGWGLSPKSTDLDGLDQFNQPESASEIINEVDKQRCINVTSDQIIPAGQAFELVHWVVPVGSVGVIERLPHIFEEVTALDAGGVPIFTYGGLNGENPCLGGIAHPDPVVGFPLTWRFHITRTDMASLEDPSTASPLRYVGPVSPDSISGYNVLPPWRDLRYGTLSQFSTDTQYVLPASIVIRYWVVLFGPQNRFTVRIGGRLGGYWQLGGRKGAALSNATIRRI
jgi:hypothetical protein